MNYTNWIKQSNERDIMPSMGIKTKETYWVVYSRYIALCATKDYETACRICTRHLEFDGSSCVVRVN